MTGKEGKREREIENALYSEATRITINTITGIYTKGEKTTS